MIMRKRNIIIAVLKTWNLENALKFKRKFGKEYRVFIFKDIEKLNSDLLKTINPEYVFFPHWSWIIPEVIYEKYRCVVFHMTDLPYGRGGTPLQNLILKGFDKTKISALKVAKELDAGPVYAKQNLSLKGSAGEIYKRASAIIFNKMIPDIIKKSPLPKKQSGKIVLFKRRKPGQSNMQSLKNIGAAYDFIRMLDAEGYPKAFIETPYLKLEFSNAKKRQDNVFANVKITKKEKK